MIGKFGETNWKEIKNSINTDRKNGKVIGAASGSFDVAIARHALSLDECKKHCDILLIFLNSDFSVKSYKGPYKPVNTEDERAYMVSSFRSVDHIILFDQLTPVDLIKEIRPDVYFNLSEWGEDCVEKHILDTYGGSLKVFDVELPADWSGSTTELISKIKKSEEGKTKKAVFLDRDGVINDNRKGYIHSWGQFKFLPGVLSSLKKLSDSEYELIIITNQSGVARGHCTIRDIVNLHTKMLSYLENEGVHVDGLFFCPHHPNDGCSCRKPGIGMFLEAAKNRTINLSKSWFIGDNVTDIEAGRYANVKTILVGKKENAVTIKPNYYAKDLEDAIGVFFSL